MLGLQGLAKEHFSIFKEKLFPLPRFALEYVTQILLSYFIMWRIDPLLSSDSVNIGLYYVTPVTYTQQ
jgi:hypothetical protein